MIRPEWVLDCVKANKLLPYVEYLLLTNPQQPRLTFATRTPAAPGTTPSEAQGGREGDTGGGVGHSSSDRSPGSSGPGSGAKSYEAALSGFAVKRRAIEKGAKGVLANSAAQSTTPQQEQTAEGATAPRPHVVVLDSEGEEEDYDDGGYSGQPPAAEPQTPLFHKPSRGLLRDNESASGSNGAQGTSTMCTPAASTTGAAADQPAAVGARSELPASSGATPVRSVEDVQALLDTPPPPPPPAPEPQPLGAGTTTIEAAMVNRRVRFAEEEGEEEEEGKGDSPKSEPGDTAGADPHPLGGDSSLHPPGRVLSNPQSPGTLRLSLLRVAACSVASLIELVQGIVCSKGPRA